MSDRLLVQNSQATQDILQAKQEEAGLSRQVAIQSQRLAEETMKDSVAMKTVRKAIMCCAVQMHTSNSLPDCSFDDDFPSRDILRSELYIDLSLPGLRH